MTVDVNVLKNTLEAALMSAGEPLGLDRLRQLFIEYDGLKKADIIQALDSLNQEYQTRALELAELASGYVIRVRAEYMPRLTKLWQERPQKPSRAFMETLAIIAYRQPITRAEIEDIRGVAVSSGIIKNLLEREWITLVGYRDLPGKPGLYATTKHFLDHFSLKSLEELPPLEAIVHLSEISDATPHQEADVTENGQLDTLANMTHSGAVYDTVDMESLEQTLTEPV